MVVALDLNGRGTWGRLRFIGRDSDDEPIFRVSAKMDVVDSGYTTVVGNPETEESPIVVRREMDSE